jgi:hypothetical protein
MDSNLLMPQRQRTGANSVITINSKADASMISKMSRKIELSVMHVDANEDNSDIIKRLDVDMDEKPQLDDKRARMMIIN